MKSTLEVIRFDAELEERANLKSVIARLDGNTIKLSGYSESARIRASEAKDNFPKRHDWDSYFRDARNMDEKKPGERPDTIHISNLPIRWFCPRHLENEENVKPSESIFKRIFEKFGSVRMVDIPICDPFRKDMKSHMTGMKTFSFDQDLYFEGYASLYSAARCLTVLLDILFLLHMSAQIRSILRVSGLRENDGRIPRYEAGAQRWRQKSGHQHNDGL